jgi:excisionase family DNA binding protein
VSLEDAIERVVTTAVEKAFAPYLRRLADPEPLVYSVPETAHVLRTSTNTVRRLIEDGALPTVPHMGQRVLIPRSAVVRLVESGQTESDDSRTEPVRLSPRPGAA